MCSTPQIPEVQDTSTEIIKTPTQADASVQKISSSNRKKVSMLNPNIKTSALGLADEVNTVKKRLLGE